MLIGAQIAQLRSANSLTQEELAAIAGCSVDVVRRLEQGQRDWGRLPTLKKIAAALDSDLALVLSPRGR